MRNTFSLKYPVTSCTTSWASRVRTSYIVKRMPPIFSSLFRPFCTRLTVCRSRLRPSRAKYSHCSGMMTESAATRPFSVRMPSDGGQSMKM